MIVRLSVSKATANQRRVLSFITFAVLKCYERGDGAFREPLNHT